MSAAAAVGERLVEVHIDPNFGIGGYVHFRNNGDREAELARLGLYGCRFDIARWVFRWRCSVSGEKTDSHIQRPLVIFVYILLEFHVLNVKFSFSLSVELLASFTLFHLVMKLFQFDFEAIILGADRAKGRVTGCATLLEKRGALLGVAFENSTASDILGWGGFLGWRWSRHDKWLILAMLDFNSFEWLLIILISIIRILVTFYWLRIGIRIINISDARLFFAGDSFEGASRAAYVTWPSIDALASSLLCSTVTSYRTLSILAPFTPVFAFSSSTVAHAHIDGGALASDFSFSPMDTFACSCPLTFSTSDGTRRK